MNKEEIKNYLADLRHFKLFPRRYKTPQGRPLSYWTDVRMELAYLRVLQDGFFSGAYPSIYKGIVIPRRIGYGTFSHIKDIRLAF